MTWLKVTARIRTKTSNIKREAAGRLEFGDSSKTTLESRGRSYSSKKYHDVHLIRYYDYAEYHF